MKDGFALFKSVSGLKLSSQTLFMLLGVACSAFVWNLAGSAQAIVLQRGDTGSDVTYLQNLLNDNGYGVPVTGYYGSQTEDQVYNFQADSALAADGVAGNATFDALEGFQGVLPDPGAGGLLRFGDEGDGVLEVQRLLNDNGYFYGPYTGYFGSSTEQAVINFQADYGLSADGVVGSATLAAMRSGGGDFQPIVGSALAFGDSGPDVENLQQLLNDNGYSVAVTGYFGGETEQQVRSFQYDSYLSVDGIAGSATLAALRDGFVSLRPVGDEMADGYRYLYGDSSSGVLGIQQFLRDRGYYYGPLDGIYGSATYDAVASYQRAQGIPVDGLWGPQTAAASV